MKLWQNTSDNVKTSISAMVEQFTIGQDTIWDLYLAEADIKGSLAHTSMLHEIGLLTTEELKEAHEGLQSILKMVLDKSFVIEEGVEDVHSQVELLLTQMKGEVGKKIHAGRSRNDQSLLDIKLFLKSELKQIVEKTETVFNTLIDLSEKHKNDLLPGYTHFQLAMPSSFGLWFGAYAESLSDDLELILAAYAMANKNPLGSGAGYGSSFPLNRSFTTLLLNFESMNHNVVYAQMTRGKMEKTTAMALSGIAATLTKFSMDVCLYMNQHFGFISFPKELTTGSSIMPHKKNPDIFELIRAKCNRIQALPNELTLLTNNLPSGYHRDMQLTKECLFPAIITLKECLDMLQVMLENITIKQNILSDEKYLNLFTVEAVNELVLSGIPFREAYKIVSKQVEENQFIYNYETLNHTHEGSIGNLQNDKIKEEFIKKKKKMI
ncbi:argininosuccinate lyase [Flavobacterium columnare]|uniref:Argininosuccinate lyase n=1 Tax=Flavobacterium columnare TaxID=996 RepID=A0AA94F1J3_9FLAO|nr:argininosuccinate lyase [Flavobacterium columnare]MCH4829835.1 argininosuccinate lyase [Flavobacterium columnare]MCH4832785.1 argininosuccinate lyase [Flavobacterium columnare]